MSGPAVMATDVDLGDVLTFGIVSVDPSQAADVLVIDPTTGVISVQQVDLPVFNYECDREEPLFGCPGLHRTFTVTISVTDSGVGNLTAIGMLSITVTDVSEPPVVP